MLYDPLAPYSVDDDRFKGNMSSGWITDLNSSDSRIHKEKVIEKALMAAKLKRRGDEFVDMPMKYR